MNKGDNKRTFDQMEQSQSQSHAVVVVDVNPYVFSEIEHRTLKTLAAKRRRFLDKRSNYHLDVHTKKAALNASHYVVSLVSFSGEVAVSQGSGTIIECQGNTNIVMASLNLIRRPTEEDFLDVAENRLADNLKIVVRSSDDNSYIGEIVGYDLHYNLLIIKFTSKVALQSAKLKMIEGDVGFEKSFLRPHGSNIKPGDPVLVVGRYFFDSCDIMAAPGSFSMDRCEASEYDCRELLIAGCSITLCGDGAPLINLTGEVIGIVYFGISPSSPFLPINIASKWWNRYKRYKEQRHPSYGFEASNLYTADLTTLEMVLKRFPSISNGLIVEKVRQGSHAHSAGLREDDVIITCDGKTVRCFLELWELMWDKVAQSVDLEVARVDLSTLLTITMTIGEAAPNELNNWPRFVYP